MRIFKWFLFSILLFISFPLFAKKNIDKIEKLEMEVQELRERVTELNNLFAPYDKTSSWGRGISLGVPIGFNGNDPASGLEAGYSITSYLGMRLDLNVIFGKNNNILFQPMLGLLGKSPIMGVTRLYGGLFFGTYQLQNVGDKYEIVYFNFKALAGIELFMSKNSAFFVETGSNIYYNNNFTLVGTRFYF